VLYAAARLQIEVPRQLSVVCVSHEHVSTPGLPVAVARQFFSEVGRTAIARLMSKVEHPGQEFPPVAIESTWHPGATVAPPDSL
jgi:DNA-binding LacI/PurR family transcriptional regulator